MGRIVTVATCTLNQLALDFQGNVERIIKAIRKAKDAGARYLCGTEMSITGYGCGDHYHERDTEMHAWEALAIIMQDPTCSDIMVDVGLPVMHKNVLYNCKLVFVNRKVLFIRPKMMLANDGSNGYKETRWFAAWTKIRELEEYQLPSVITSITGQKSAAFGDGMVETKDTTIGIEICEELWNPESCHIGQCLDGAEIIANGLGAMEECRTQDLCYRMVQMASMKSGGCYLFANQEGFDGSSGYYSGQGSICLNGNLLAHTELHTIRDVEVVTATIDLDVVRQYKVSIRSRSIHAAKTKSYPRVKVDFSMSNVKWRDSGIPTTVPIEPKIPTKPEQILKVPALWMWDYLRRSGRKGIILLLSEKLDSVATGAIVFSMCHLVMEAVKNGDDNVLADVQQVVGQSEYVPNDARELCSRLVRSLDVASSSGKSASVPKEFIDEFSEEIGCHPLKLDLNTSVECMIKSIIHSGDDSPCGKDKKYDDENMESKTQVEEDKELNRSKNILVTDKEKPNNEAVQSLASRVALAAAYFLAESGMAFGNSRRDLIVLSSSNADNLLEGSDVKYGKTYGDVNLIGNFRREDIARFLLLAKERLNLLSLEKLNLKTQSEECIASISLGAEERCGPLSMFGRLWHKHKDTHTPAEVADEVKECFKRRSHLRQNTLCFPPTCYMPCYGPPDDGGPLVYPRSWGWQFRALDKKVQEMLKSHS